MADYIRREDALMAVCRADLPDKTEDGVPIANGKRKVSDCVRRIKDIPAADVIKEQKNTIKSYEGTIRKLVDAIEELQKENKEILFRASQLEAMYDSFTHWIPCSERLPEEEKTVLTWGKEHQCILLDWMHDNKWCCFGDADYWMSLPSPPKEE